MNDHLLTAMHIAQSLLNLLGILWLMLGMRNKDRTRKGYYDRLTRVHLPSSLCIYTALLLGVLTCRMQQSSDLFYLIMLCLETLLIEDMIVRALSLRQELSDACSEGDTQVLPPQYDKDDDSNSPDSNN